MQSKLPLKLIVRLTLGIFLISLLEIYWKYLACNILLNKSFFQLLNLKDLSYIFLLVLILAGQFTNWLKVLKLADLSFIEPIMTISYIFVDIFSYFIFHEAITLKRITGTLIIIFGVWLISGTKHSTITAIPKL